MLEKDRNGMSEKRLKVVFFQNTIRCVFLHNSKELVKKKYTHAHTHTVFFCLKPESCICCGGVNVSNSWKTSKVLTFWNLFIRRPESEGMALLTAFEAFPACCVKTSWSRSPPAAPQEAVGRCGCYRPGIKLRLTWGQRWAHLSSPGFQILLGAKEKEPRRTLARWAKKRGSRRYCSICWIYLSIYLFPPLKTFTVKENLQIKALWR